MSTDPPTGTYPFPTLPVEWATLYAIHQKVLAGGCAYRYGSKPPIGALPGSFHESDCSGYVRYLLLNSGVDSLPDGSQNEGDAIRAAGMKLSSPAALNIGDGALRVAILPPLEQDGNIGHIQLWHNSMSIECCGSRGVCRRTVQECQSFLPYLKVYVLTAPGSN